MLGRTQNSKEDSSSQVESTIRAWARGEAFPWRRRRVLYSAAVEEFSRLNVSVPGAYLYRFEGNEVTLADKPDALNPTSLRDRAETYLRFFKTVIAHRPLNETISLALGVGDGPLDSEIAPTFSFQKPIGHTTLLVNDINMIEGDFYESMPFVDTLAFEQKQHKCVFVGSTSGMHNTAESVRARANRRIDAALYFKDVESVDFSLPNIVQCEPEAEALIRSMGVGSEYIGWQRQFNYKFLLSLDGNGAACQRIAVALKSKSAVLKYDSTSLLYYFKGLTPWYHYVPISEHSEVVDVIGVDSAVDDLMRLIAENGAKFSETFLSRRAQEMYFWYLLAEYCSIFK